MQAKNFVLNGRSFFITNMKEDEIMTRKQLERKYEERGLNNYRIRTVDDLKAVHNIDIEELKGYENLSDEYRELFEKTIIHFFNAQGLEKRAECIPKAINYVQETEYISESNIIIGKIIKAIYKNNKSRIIHRYVFEKDISFSKCRKYTNEYLRFELKGEWFHITENEQWY